MLVLSRRANESLMIGSDVVVTVLEVRGDQVRIGIKAPRSVTVHREEVYAELIAQNKAAASPVPNDVDLGALSPRAAATPETAPDA